MSRKRRNNRANLKVIPLGGLGEIGKNMTAYEYEDDIIVIDAGISFPEDEMLGIDVVIPDITYLERNIEKVKAVFYTHGHEDHIGGTPYLLRKINVPLYGTKLTLGLIQHKLKEHRQVKKPKMFVKQPGDKVQVGKFEVEFIRVSHSIPDAVSFAIKTPAATVVQTGDFKVDFTPVDGERIDLTRFAELGAEGVDLLLADSTNVERAGYTMSESSVGATFDALIGQAEKRVIVASFASNVHRVQQIVNAGLLHNRKIAFSGRSMHNVSRVAMELGYLKMPKEALIEVEDLHRYPENEIVVITTGSQGEPMAALTRMANREHRSMEVREGDTVIISASPIPGNEKSIRRVIDRLNKIGAEVIFDELADVHVSGHACQEELKLIQALVKPKNFMPVHGEYTHLKHHAQLSEKMGLDSKNVFILETGDTLEVNKKFAKRGKKVPSGQILIDGLGIGDVGNIVLRDRKHLSEDGLMIVVVGIHKESGKTISGPDIISRGFVYVKESEALMQESRKVVVEALDGLKKKEIRDWSTIKNTVRDALRSHIYQKTKRSPMILPIIMEV